MIRGVFAVMSGKNDEDEKRRREEVVVGFLSLFMLLSIFPIYF